MTMDLNGQMVPLVLDTTVLDCILDPNVIKLSDVEFRLSTLVNQSLESVVDALLVSTTGTPSSSISTASSTAQSLQDQYTQALGKLLPMLPFPPLYQRYSALFRDILIKASTASSTPSDLILSLLRSLSPQDCQVLIQAPETMAALITFCLEGGGGEEKSANRVSILTSLFQAITSTPTGLDALFSSEGPCLMTLTRMAQGLNAAVRFRVFDVLTAVAAQSSHHLDRILASGILTPMLQELESTDVLIALNAVEGLKTFCTSDWGVGFLVASGVLARMSQLFTQGPPSSTKDMSAILLTCGVIKFFSHLFQQRPSLVPQFPGLLESWTLFLNPGDDMVPPVECKEAILVAIGIIGSSPSGYSVLPVRLLEEFFDLGGSSSCKVMFYQCLSCLLAQTPSDDEASEEISLVVFQRMHDKHPRFFPAVSANADGRGNMTDLSGGGGELIMACKSSILEVKTAAYAILRAITYHAWGLQFLALRPATLTFLLSRATENMKPGFEWKFAIAQQIIATSRRVGGDLTKHQSLFEVYVRQGVFYKQAEVVVATQSR